MTTRVSPTDRIRAEIDALFAADRDLGEVVEDVARLGARLILQSALEAEVTEFLGRERHERGDRARAGSRNGHSDVTVKTIAGPVSLERPKLRGTDEVFASRLLGKHVTRTKTPAPRAPTWARRSGACTPSRPRRSSTEAAMRKPQRRPAPARTATEEGDRGRRSVLGRVDFVETTPADPRASCGATSGPRERRIPHVGSPAA